jgi:predicted dithiol-disulfide oxidoreductase (DUF899 family)
MGEYHAKRFPGESDSYRNARDSLLSAERALRKNIEEVAALRRTLPPGGALKQDYVFEEISDASGAASRKFSELFEGGKESLFLYSLMFAPDDEAPCPACNSILDSLNGAAPHIRDRINFAVIAKTSPEKLRAWASGRGWNNLRLLSSQANSYNADYFGETPEGNQIPAINVFRKTEAGIHHFYNSELLYSPSEAGQHPRHADMIWPLWNVFDLTPEGRGNWGPRLSYD